MSSPTLYLGSKITVNPTGLIMDLSGANIMINKSVPELDNALYAVNKQYVDSKLSDQYNLILGATTSDLDTFQEVVSAFKNADMSLNSAITNLSNAATSSLAIEVSTARAAESVLRSDLSTEVSTARSAEGVLTSDLSTEVSTARSAEAVLRSDLSSEVIRATSVESVLESGLAAEISTARAAESVLTANLSTELSVARSNEVVLNDRINALCVYFFKNASQF